MHLAVEVVREPAVVVQPAQVRAADVAHLQLLVARGAGRLGERPELALAVLPLATFAALNTVERVDWNFLVQKTTVVVEWALAFGLIFGLTRRMAPAGSPAAYSN